MQKRIAIGVLALASLTLSACSKSSTPAADESGNTVFNSALTTVSSKMEEFDAVLPNNAGASSISISRSKKASRNSVGTKAAFGTNWDDNASLSNPRCSGGDTTICNTAVTPKEWMGYQLDPDAVRENGSDINIFGRFNSAIRISCAIMNLLTVDSTTGYPSDGEQSIEFTSAATSIMVSKCGFDSDEASGMVGEEITATVSTPDDTTYYDKKIQFVLSEAMGGGSQSFYMRVNSTAVNIMTAETNENGISRTIVALDKSNNILRVEYFSGGSTTSGGFNFYRLYFDETNDVGRLFGYESDATGSGGIRYTLAGKPSTGTEAALSMDLKGWGSGGTWDKNYKACVTMDTGDIATDNTLSCAGSVTGTDIDDASLVSVYDEAFNNRADSGWYSDSGATTTLTYDATTIYSALPTH